MKLEHVIARSIADLREKKRWTQSDLAQRMRAAGLGNWQANRVTQIETFRRPVSLLEVLMLSWVFGVPIVGLLAGAEDVELPGGSTIPLPDLRSITAGDGGRVKPLPGTRMVPGADELRRIAKRLELPVHVTDWLAETVYGRHLIEEREARLGDVSALSKRSAQTKRGNATRAIISELAGYIRAEGGTEPVWMAYLQQTGGTPPRYDHDKTLSLRDAYLEGHLGAVEVESVDAHLRECYACWSEYGTVIPPSGPVRIFKSE